MRTAVIIGGGLGGLFTGAILAKEGFQVIVLEKNKTIGGVFKLSVVLAKNLIQVCMLLEVCSLEVISIEFVGI